MIANLTIVTIYCTMKKTIWLLLLINSFIVGIQKIGGEEIVENWNM